MTSVKTETDMQTLGTHFAQTLKGGEVIELVGDVGAGKTTFVKGVGAGLAVDEDVQSPSFTISRVYPARAGLELHHYDFYRLNDAGVMSYELAESIEDPKAVTIIEWADTVEKVLPTDHAVIRIHHTPDGEGREVHIELPASYDYLKDVV